MIIKLATESDINDIIYVIKQRCDWFKKNNIDQWNEIYYLRKYNFKYFTNMVHTNNLYIATENDEIIGVFLLKTEDKPYWKDNKKAYYIHHFATKLQHSGTGIKMLKFIEDLAKENGVNYIRLDCLNENTKLNDYYQKNGFIKKGEGKINYYHFNLWEKII